MKFLHVTSKLNTYFFVNMFTPFRDPTFKSLPMPLRESCHNADYPHVDSLNNYNTHILLVKNKRRFY